jgi:hypothetical protein
MALTRQVTVFCQGPSTDDHLSTILRSIRTHRGEYEVRGLGFVVRVAKDHHDRTSATRPAAFRSCNRSATFRARRERDATLHDARGDVPIPRKPNKSMKSHQFNQFNMPSQSGKLRKLRKLNFPNFPRISKHIYTRQ